MRDDVWHDVENLVITKPSHTSATGNNTMAQGPSSPQQEHVCCADGGLANDLPVELLVTSVTPSPGVEASAAAKAVQPGDIGPNYSD
ncbi:allene oxide cyclase [Tanacetum coccineum]